MYYYLEYWFSPIENHGIGFWALTFEMIKIYNMIACISKCRSELAGNFKLTMLLKSSSSLLRKVPKYFLCGTKIYSRKYIGSDDKMTLKLFAFAVTFCRYCSFRLLKNNNTFGCADLFSLEVSDDSSKLLVSV